MPPERDIAGSPADWLARARGDLAISKLPLPAGGYYEDLCLHAQQAAEKAIKAVYLASGLRFHYTHNLSHLFDGLQRKGIGVPPNLLPAIDLTDYAHQTRYPGMSDPVTEAEYRRAVELAETVVEWAESQVRDAVR